MIVKDKESKKGLALPITKVETHVTILESLAHVSISQTFVNPEGKNPVEIAYRFPKVKGSFISRLAISIGDDRVIEAKIAEKTKAQDMYEDAMITGHGAVFVEDDN